MSVCFNRVRRSLCTIANGKRAMSTLMANHNNFALPSSASTATTVTSATAPTIATNNSPPLLQRNFSAAKKSPKKESETSTLSYQARKDAAKQKRRELYERKQQRLLSLHTRRDGKDVGRRKREFRAWYDKELLYHDILERKARQAGKPWRIRVAVMLERLPVVTPDMEDWEREYVELKEYLMTFGKVIPPEVGFMPPEKEEDHVVMSDEEMLALLPFTPAPRETEADATGNVKTRDRQLKTRLFLTILTQNEGIQSGSSRWTLPSTLAKHDETLLQAAQRAVSESIGNDLVLWCPSNAPMALNYRVYNKNMPEEIKGEYYGEKIFYYRVQWDNGDVDESSLEKGGVDDYAWLTREEIVEKVEEERGVHQATFFRYML